MGDTMKKMIFILTSVATVAVAVAAMPAPAEARGLGLGLGLAGGLVGGAIIGGAIASPHYYGPGYYAPAYRYAPAPVYDDESGCRWTHQQYWDGYGWRIRRVPVCG